MFKKAVTSGVSLFALATAATPAMATTPTAGATITNTATVAYKVGGVDKTGSGTKDFLVDRKINLLVTKQDTSEVLIQNGSQKALKFNVQNLTNETIDILLSAANLTGDDTDVTALKIYKDDGDGVFEPGTDDVEITYLDEVTSGTTVTVWVGATGPDATDGNLANVSLTGTAAAGGTASSSGAAFTETTGADTSAVDNVFADLGATGGNTARDGKSLDSATFKVVNKTLTVTKSSTAIYDPLNGTTNPKMIPGAIVKYCITVNNPSGNADATNVVVTDNVPTNMTYSSTSDGTTSYGVRLGTDCSPAAGSAGSISGSTVTGDLGTVSGGTSETVVFHAKID